MKQSVVRWRFSLVGLAGVMVCVLLLFGACDNPAASDAAPDDVGSGDDEDGEIVAGYTITYIGNGEESGAPPVDTAEYYGGQTIQIAPQGDLRGAPIRDGITQSVTHWTTQADGSGDVYVSGSTTSMPEHDLALHAQWSTGDEVIGKTGPSGGWIFYEATTPDGWTYLEAAPEDLVIDGRETWQWGAQGHHISGLFGLDDPVGSGLEDTQAIVAFHDSLSSTDDSNSSYYEYSGDFGETGGFTDNAEGSYTFSSENDGSVAAKLCNEYTVVSGDTTYDDWFLPSEAELAAMYTNLRVVPPQPLGAFDPHGGYWSANGYLDDRARAKWFYGDGSEIGALKSGSYRIRPGRRF